jgi:hypothetical protein
MHLPAGLHGARLIIVAPRTQATSMTEERCRDADMNGVVNRHARSRAVAKQMRIYWASESLASASDDAVVDSHLGRWRPVR